ncbi:MAG: GGDEF domain-containing protein [Acidobacteria bacterium]|nr:GGDEF domain-containing protein [Acidobacteriota bacterium]
MIKHFFLLAWLFLPQNESVSDQQMRIQALIDDANVLSEQDANQAKELAQKALDMAIIAKERNKEAQARHTLGIAERKLGLYDLAEREVKKAVFFYEKNDLKKELATALNTLGLIQSDQGAYTQALESQLRALDIRREINDRQGMAYSYNNLGNIYRNTGEFEKALEYLQLSLTIKLELGDLNSIVFAYNNLGNTYRRMGQFEQARMQYERALDLAEQSANKTVAAGPLKNIGTLLEEENQYQEALGYYQRALEIRRTQGDRRNEVGVLNNIGRIYLRLGQNDQAIEVLNESLKIGLEIGVHVIYMETYGLLSDAYLAKGDAHKALEYYKIHSEEFKALFNERNSTRLMELQTQFETQEKEREIQHLADIASAQKREQYLQNRIMVFLSVALLGIIVLFYSRYRAEARAKGRLLELSQKLDHKSKELAKTNQELEKQATSDALTGLPNRRALEYVINLEWHKCVRAQQPFSLLMIDIDHFKPYNDTLGHQAGDECLKTISDILRRTIVRSGDFVCRFGGEEFLAILFFTDEKGTQKVAESLRKAVLDENLPHPNRPDGDLVTLSIGACTVWKAEDYQLDQAISAADEALYEAKNRGRNRVISKNLGINPYLGQALLPKPPLQPKVND